MKKGFLCFLALLCTFALSQAFAEEITFNWGSDNTYTFKDVPDDLYNLINSNKGAIEEALKENNVSKEDLEKVADEIKNVYKDGDLFEDLGTDSPYTTIVNGLDGFSDVLKDAIPNTQIQQNVWANSWIGYLVQVKNGGFCPRFGFGANLGAAKLDLTPLLDTADAFKMDIGDAPDTLVMPTVTADIRLGGIKVGDFELPFDFGFTLCTIDSSRLGLDSYLEDVSFDYLSLGFDIRYCLWKPDVLDTRFSVGVGYYYTKGSVDISGDDASAGLDFKSSNFTLNAQISTKLLFFRPFVGARVMFTNSSADWYAKGINWSDILGGDDEKISQAIDWGILPDSFDGGSSGFNVRPVVQGGFAFDLAVIDLTFSGSYDLSSNIWGGAFSLRFSL